MLVIVSLLLATTLASKQVALDSELKSTLHEIASRYGLSNHEVMTLVTLSDPKTQMLDKLNALLTQLRTEQNDADDEHQNWVASKQQERQNLIDTLNSIKDQIQDTQNQINQNQGNIGSLDSDESQLRNEANEADSQVKLYQALLDRLHQDHDANVARYADIIQHHDDSLATIQQLIDMVSNFQFSEALALISKQRHQFLHRKHSQVALLVKSTIQLIEKEGPKNDIKQKLLALLDRIKQGTVDSRALYVDEAHDEVDQFNQTSSSYSTMIENFVAQRDQALAQLADLIAQKSQEQDDMSQNQGSLDNLQDSLINIGGAISSLDAEVANEAQQYQTQTQGRIDDMNAVEAAIQYVNDHVQGMSVHDLCHIGAPGCYRCLTSSDCDQGQECSDDGKCQAQPKPVVIGGTVDEHATLNLGCPGEKNIKDVKFASYGMPTGSFPDFQDGWCDASSSEGVVTSICTGQHSCSIRAENDVFGDPCSDTVKHLSVAVVCA